MANVIQQIATFAQDAIRLGVKFLFANNDEGKNDFEDNLRKLSKILGTTATTQKVDKRVATKRRRIAPMDSHNVLNTWIHSMERLCHKYDKISRNMKTVLETWYGI